MTKASGIGGSERHLLALLPLLAARGVDVRCCVLVTGDGQRLVHAMRDAGIETTSIPSGPDVNPRLLLALRREIRRQRPDLVHTHLIHGDLYGQIAARLANTRGISSVHSSHSFYERGAYHLPAQLAGRLGTRTIAISEHVARVLLAGRVVAPSRLRIVPYGIDSAAWTAGADERSAARESFAMKPEEIVVGIASRLVRYKGHDTLIDAFARARMLPTAPRLRLMIAGDGPLREDLEARAAKVLPADTYDFLGFISNVRAFMHACDVIVFPTQPEFGEGFGLAALEAMAAGRPLIASSVASLPELVVDNKTGVLVPPGEAVALAAQIAWLASDAQLRATLGDAAAQRARETFSIEAMVDGVLRVYDEAGS